MNPAHQSAQPRLMTLDNGLPVLIVPAIQNQGSAALYLARTGSRYESMASNGLSRFAVLMSLKKTEQFSTQQALLEAVDRVGAYINFETNREYTALYTKSYNPYFKDSLNLLSQMIIKPAFDQADIDQEKQYFYTEIKNRAESMMSVGIDELFSMVYGGHPISYSGVGAEDAVSGFSLDMVYNFRKAFYGGQNSLLIVCADVENVDEIVASAFQDLPEGNRLEGQPLPETGVEEHAKDIPMSGQQSSTVLGFPALSRNSESKSAQILTEVILGKMKSNTRLGALVREKVPVKASTGLYQFSDTGLLVVEATSDSRDSEVAYGRLMDEVAKMASGDITDEEVERAKGYYKGLLMLGMQDPVERAFFYGLQQLLETDVESEEDFVGRLDAVSIEEVRSIAQQLINMESLYQVRVGKV